MADDGAGRSTNSIDPYPVPYLGSPMVVQTSYRHWEDDPKEPFKSKAALKEVMFVQGN